MGAAEGVVDVGGGIGGERRGEDRIVLLLAGMEAQILEQRDVAIAELRRDRRRRLADRVVSKEHRPAQQCRQSLGHWPQRVLEVALALRPPAVRAQEQPGARRGELANRR